MIHFRLWRETNQSYFTSNSHKASEMLNDMVASFTAGNQMGEAMKNQNTKSIDSKEKK